MKKLHYFIMLIAALGMSAFGIYHYAKNQCNKHACLSFSLLDNATEMSTFEDTEAAYRAMFMTSKGQLRLSKHMGLSEKDANDLTHITKMKIGGLFDNALSPYPGPLSSTITCDDKYKPVPQVYSNGSIEITMFSAYLNNRLQYGTCIDNQITHKGYNAIVYCDNERSWYQLELLIPMEKVETDAEYFSLFHTISC